MRICRLQAVEHEPALPAQLERRGARCLLARQTSLQQHVCDARSVDPQPVLADVELHVGRVDRHAAGANFRQLASRRGCRAPVTPTGAAP